MFDVLLRSPMDMEVLCNCKIVKFGLISSMYRKMSLLSRCFEREIFETKFSEPSLACPKIDNLASQRVTSIFTKDECVPHFFEPILQCVKCTLSTALVSLYTSQLTDESN